MNSANRQIILEIPPNITSGEIELDSDKKIVWQIIANKPENKNTSQYRTPLGKRLGEIRSKVVSSGGHLLNREELDKEILDRRGVRGEENLH